MPNPVAEAHWDQIPPGFMSPGADDLNLFLQNVGATELTGLYTYEEGTDTAAVPNNANGVFATSGTPVYAAASAIHGGLGVSLPASSISYKVPPSFQFSIYGRYDVVGTPGAAGLLNFNGRVNSVGVATIKYDGSAGTVPGRIFISDTTAAVKAASTTHLFAGDLFRLDGTVDNSKGSTVTISVDIYAPGNTEGTVPTETISATFAISNSVDTFRPAPTAGFTLSVDTLRLYRGIDNVIGPYAPATLTSVTATRATSWDVDAAVASSRATTWSVAASVLATRATSWTALASVAATRATSWTALSAVLASRATTWVTLAAVSATRATTWVTRAAVAATRATTWNIAAAVGATRATSWTTAGSVASTRATTWAALTSAAATRATTWRTLAAVLSTRATTWNVAGSLTSVGSTRPTTWTVRAVVTATRATTWTTRAGVTSTSATQWSALASTTATRATVWETKAQAASARATTWNTLAGVAPPLFAIRASLAAAQPDNDPGAVAGLRRGSWANYRRVRHDESAWLGPITISPSSVVLTLAVTSGTATPAAGDWTAPTYVAGRPGYLLNHPAAVGKYSLWARDGAGTPARFATITVT